MKRFLNLLIIFGLARKQFFSLLHWASEYFVRFCLVDARLWEQRNEEKPHIHFRFSELVGEADLKKPELREADNRFGESGRSTFMYAAWNIW